MWSEIYIVNLHVYISKLYQQFTVAYFVLGQREEKSIGILHPRWASGNKYYLEILVMSIS